MTSGAVCSPCFKKTCDQWFCMRDITVEGVFEAVREVFLQEKTPESLKNDNA